MKVSALKAGTRTVPVVIPGEDGGPDEDVQVTYRPGALTLDMMESTDKNNAEGMKDFLMSDSDPLLTGWDLENDDGTAFPCDRDHLGQLPLPFLALIADAIGEDSKPNPRKAGNSDAGSQQREESGNVQTGTLSSEQQRGLVALPGSS